jgi:hypothetical protein
MREENEMDAGPSIGMRMGGLQKRPGPLFELDRRMGRSTVRMHAPGQGRPSKTGELNQDRMKKQEVFACSITEGL